MDALMEILESFPKSLLQGITGSFLIIVLAYVIIWRLLKKRLTHWRIQMRERVDMRQLKREWKNAAFTLSVGAAFSSTVLYLSSQGYTKIYTNLSDHGLFWAVTSFFILLVIDDTWFYWCHRLLHHPKIFKWVHLEHHKSVDVNPFTSFSFHWLEPLLLTVWIVPVSFLVPMYAPTLMAVQLWGLLDNLKSHVGYEFYPAGLLRSPLRFLTSSTYHNMHHLKFKGNYGVHFRLWDRLLGTEFPDYESEYDAIQERKRKGPQSSQA